MAVNCQLDRERLLEMALSVPVQSDRVGAGCSNETELTAVCDTGK